MRSVLVRTNRRCCNLRIGLSAPRGEWTKFVLRSHPKDPKRSDTHTEAVRLALGELCRDHRLLLLVFGLASFSFKLPDHHSGGCCAAARRVLRSPTDCAAAPQASSPRPPPLASLSFCPRVRLSFRRG